VAGAGKVTGDAGALDGVDVGGAGGLAALIKQIDKEQANTYNEANTNTAQSTLTFLVVPHHPTSWRKDDICATQQRATHKGQTDGGLPAAGRE
jgi:hypothetical protein